MSPTSSSHITFTFSNCNQRQSDNCINSACWISWVSHPFLKIQSFYINKTLSRAELMLQGYFSNVFQMHKWTQIFWTPVDSVWALLILWLVHTAWSHVIKVLSSTQQVLRCGEGHLRATTTRAHCWIIPSLLLQVPHAVHAPPTKTCMKSWGIPQQNFGFFKRSFRCMLCYMYDKELLRQLVLQKIQATLKVLMQMQV